jgi:hypothetical protein
MTDQDMFEHRLADALRSYAREVSTEVDPSAFAHAIALDQPRSSGSTAWAGVRWLFGGRRTSSLAVALLAGLLTLLLVSALLVGGRLAEVTPLLIEQTGGGTFAARGALALGNSEHTAVSLHDGRVLVIGGEDGGGAGRTEIYDPASGAITSLVPIAAHDNSNGFAATVLLDGRVLIAGGRFVDNMIDPPWPASDRAILFDPRTGIARQTGRLTVARESPSATLLSDGRVLLAGGLGTWGRVDVERLSSAELYDPATETFTPTGAMACRRTASRLEGLSVALLPSGRVLLHGGGCGDFDAAGEPNTASDEIYDPVTGTFGSVVERGPDEGDSSVILTGPDLIYRYDLARATITDITPQPAELVRAYGNHCRDLHDWGCRFGMEATRLADGRVLLTGGMTAVVRPAGSQGARSEVRTTAEVFDPASGAVRSTGPLVEPRSAHTATLLPDGRVVLIGGYLRTGDVSRTYRTFVEIFTPD